MKVGLLKDIKDGEFRTIMTPNEAAELVSLGAEVFVELEQEKEQVLKMQII